MADLLLTDTGSNLFLLTPVSQAADDWCEEHLPADRLTWGGGIVVDHHYVEVVLTAAIVDGLEIDPPLSSFRPMS